MRQFIFSFLGMFLGFSAGYAMAFLAPVFQPYAKAIVPILALVGGAFGLIVGTKTAKSSKI